MSHTVLPHVAPHEGEHSALSPRPPVAWIREHIINEVFRLYFLPGASCWIKPNIESMQHHDKALELLEPNLQDMQRQVGCSQHGSDRSRSALTDATAEEIPIILDMAVKDLHPEIADINGIPNIYGM